MAEQRERVEIEGASFLLLQLMLNRLTGLHRRLLKVEERNEQALTEIKQALAALLAQGAQIMTMGQETLRVIQAIDAATTDIATRIERLIADADLTAEERAEFERLVARLQALGHDPENPVPAG